MWALIRREIEDLWVYYLGMMIFAGVLILLLVTQAIYGKGPDSETSNIQLCLSFGAAASCLVFAAMGVSQMYADRMKKISAFLATQAVCRHHLYLAKLAAGILLVVIFYAAVGGTLWVMNHAYGPPVFSGRRLWIYYPVTVTAAGLACYVLGLSMGWTSGKIFPTLGTLALAFLLLSLLLIKGMNVSLYFLLILFIVSSLIRTWLVYRHSAF